MLWSTLKNLRRSAAAPAPTIGLHIGGQVRKDGWEILNANPGPYVDHVGRAHDLTRFHPASYARIYASHVLEHLDFTGEMQAALREWRRVLIPGGQLLVSVPDLTAVAALLLQDGLTLDDRFKVVKFIYGAHVDDHDYHQVGFDFPILRYFLTEAGFVDVARVERFGLFDDTSDYAWHGVPISLNVTARRPPPGEPGA